MAQVQQRYAQCVLRIGRFVLDVTRRCCFAAAASRALWVISFCTAAHWLLVTGVVQNSTDACEQGPVLMLLQMLTPRHSGLARGTKCACIAIQAEKHNAVCLLLSHASACMDCLT